MQDVTFEGNGLKGMQNMSTSFLKTACDSVITKLKKIKEVINVYNLILLWVMGNRLEVNSIKINSYL